MELVVNEVTRVVPSPNRETKEAKAAVANRRPLKHRTKEVHHKRVVSCYAVINATGFDTKRMIQNTQNGGPFGYPRGISWDSLVF